MPSGYTDIEETEREEYFRNVMPKKEKRFSFVLNIILFILTFISTAFAGAALVEKDPLQLYNFKYGITYAILIMTVITTHEFGHYFAAVIHKVKVSLPYYIPFPFFIMLFGTMGAVIRIKQQYYSRKALFDIGAAGPIAGWIASVIILIIGFITLPPVQYLYGIHPDYSISGISEKGLTFGYSIAFYLFEKIFASSPNVFMPPMNEIYHYPFLCVGWFGLLITSLNMMPAGQLDGGHISYTMFGEKVHSVIAHIVFYTLLTLGLLGLIDYISELQEWAFRTNIGSLGWLVWAALLKFVIKIKHPPTIPINDEPLSPGRIAAGWFTFFIFFVSFPPLTAYYR